MDLNADLCQALTFFVPFGHHVDLFLKYLVNGHVNPRPRGDRYGYSMLESLDRTLSKISKHQGHLRHPVHSLWVYRNAVHHALPFTRLFMTEHGRVGLCSAAVRIGDCVALVDKSGCPMILRPQATFYRLVGGSYISSLTTQEAVSQASQSLVVETVTIR